MRALANDKEEQKKSTSLITNNFDLATNITLEIKLSDNGSNSTVTSQHCYGKIAHCAG